MKLGKRWRNAWYCRRADPYSDKVSNALSLLSQSCHIGQVA